MILNRRQSTVCTPLLTITPTSIYSYSLWWSLSFLRYVFVIDTSNALDIIFECTLSYKCFTSCALMDKFSRDDANKGFVSKLFPTYQMPVSPKYKFDWWCISASWIWSTWLNMLFATVKYFYQENMDSPDIFVSYNVKIILNVFGILNLNWII